MKIRIEKNVPVVTSRKPKTGLSEQVLKMDVGDSFTISSDKVETTAVYNAIKYVVKILGHSNRVYKGKLINEKQRRFWRVA